MKFLSDIEVEEGLRDKDGGLGADGQVLSSTGSLTSWIDAASGSIGGSITDNQIAVGASTTNNIEGSTSLSYIPFNVGSETTARLVVQGRLQISDQAGSDDANLYIGVNAGGVSVYGANIGIGLDALNYLTTGERNCAIGNLALRRSTVGDKNIAIGTGSLFYLAGTGQDNNVAIGDEAGQYYSTGTGALTQSSQGVYIGCDTRASANNISNEIVIGYSAVGGGSDTITLGNSSVDLLRIPGLGNTNGHVLTYSTTDGGFILAAGGGGGGGIGGTTTATEIAFGSATASTLDSDPGLTYTSGGGLSVGDTTGSGNSVITMDKGSAGQARFFMKNGGTERFSIKLDNSTDPDTYITASNTLTLATSGTTKDIILNPTGNVGVGDTSPSSKLSVAGGVQIGDDQATGLALSAKAGTLRYYTNFITPFNYSYVDMLMQTANTTYEWVNIVTKRW
mgnify:CR=1 FL=1